MWRQRGRDSPHVPTPVSALSGRRRSREVETNEPYGNQLTICRLELLRLRKQAEKCEGTIEKWAYYLKNMPTFAKKPDDESFAPFFAAADVSLLQEKDKQDYYLAMKNEYEMRVATEYSFREGMEKGIAQGKAEMAKELLSRGIDPAIVSAASGISAEDLKAL